MTQETDGGEEVSLRRQEAMHLTQAALLLDQARKAEFRTQAVVTALNHNLDMWVMIRTIAQSPDSAMSDDLRANLMTLSSFVAKTTFRDGAAISEDNLSVLININLELAEGLLQGETIPGHNAA